MNAKFLKKDFVLCYPILEKDIKSILTKIRKVDNKDIGAYELRLDHLKYINEKENRIIDIVDTINCIKEKFPSKIIIATIRTFGDGGKCRIGKERYSYYIEGICRKSKADYVDIEYAFFSKHLNFFNSLKKSYHKKIILSKHNFNLKFSLQKCKMFLDQAINCNYDILKLAVSTYSKYQVIEFMNLAKEYSKKLALKNKKCIFIAMGDMGRLSRVYPEYTNTSIVFLNAYSDKSTLGQFTLKEFEMYYNLIHR